MRYRGDVGEIWWRYGGDTREISVRPAEQQRALGHELLPRGLLRGGVVEPRQGEAVRRHLVRVRDRVRIRVRVRVRGKVLA